MIQNPTEIAACERMEQAMRRIDRNARKRFQFNRRLFICGSAATVELAALGLAGCAPQGGNSFTDLIVFGRIAGASAVVNA